MPAVVEITAESSLSTESVNVWHWLIPNSSPVTEVNNAINALDAFYTSITAQLFAQTFTIGRRVRTVDQNPNVLIAGAPQTATSSGATAAALSAAVGLHLGSSFIGGSRNGRRYIGPLVQSAIQADGRSLSAGAVSAVSGAAATLIAVTTGGIQAVIWSRKFQVATPITNISVGGSIVSQRRRIS